MTSLLTDADRITDAAEAEGTREGVGHDWRQQGGGQEVGAHRGARVAVDFKNEWYERVLGSHKQFFWGSAWTL